MLRISFYLCLACIATWWTTQINSSLWIDELQTYWVVRGNLSDTISASYTTQGFSPLYFMLLWGWKSITGSSEVALRLFSVLWVLVAAWYLYRLALEIFDRETALIAIPLLLVTDEVTNAALFARPYALALAGVTASTFYALRISRNWRTAEVLMYGLSAVLTFYSHYFFAGIYLIHVCIFAAGERTTQREYGRYLVLLATVAAVCLLALPHLETLAAKRDVMRLSTVPEIGGWLLALCAPFFLPPIVLIALLTSTISSARFNYTGLYEIYSDNKWPFYWWLVPPTLLYGLSLLTNTSFLLDRYYSWYIPGLVLIGATCIRVLVGVRVQALALLLSCALIIASDGLKQRFNEDWRAAMAHTDQLHSETSAPVLLFSGINQSQLLSWFADSRKASFFSAPAFYYPLSTTPLVIPVAVKDHSGDQYWRNVVTPVLRTNSKVILVIFNNIFEETDAGRIDIKDKLLARAALHGHRPIESQQFQQVWVYSLGRKL